MWKSRVECGDSINRMRALPDGSIGAVISDPPFLIGFGRADNRPKNFGADPWEPAGDMLAATDWANKFIGQFVRVVRPGGAIVVMAGSHAAAAWNNAADHLGLVWMAEIVVLWNTGKPRRRNFGSLHTHVLWYAVPGAKHVWNHPKISIYSNVLVCEKVPVAHRHHPSQKPVELTNFLVSLLTRPSDVVLDPFCGSGSTLVSAELAGRPYLGIDQDASYVATAKRRVAHAELEEERPIYLWVNGREEAV